MASLQCVFLKNNVEYLGYTLVADFGNHCNYMRFIFAQKAKEINIVTSVCQHLQLECAPMP